MPVLRAEDGMPKFINIVKSSGWPPPPGPGRVIGRSDDAAARPGRHCRAMTVMMRDSAATRAQSQMKMLRRIPDDPIASDWSNTGLMPR